VYPWRDDDARQRCWNNRKVPYLPQLRRGDMTSGSAIVRQPLTRDESATLFSQTMGLVAFTTAAFALGAYAARNVSSGWIWVFFIAAFVTLFGVSAVSRRSEQVAVGLLLVFGLLIGAAIAPTISYYANSDPQALWDSGGATALFIFGFGAAGYGTRRDLSKLGRTMSWALLGLILFGIVAIFAHVPNGSLLYDVIGLVIFAGLTSYDFQRLRRAKDITTAPLLAASIFLDILNVFLLFLSFNGRGKA
jgi:FtsH-binding integral membrane protein